MAKKTYVGVGNAAHLAKKMYVGVDGVAKKVKKVYVGVDNVARLAWSGEKKLLALLTASCSDPDDSSYNRWIPALYDIKAQSGQASPSSTRTYFYGSDTDSNAIYFKGKYVTITRQGTVYNPYDTAQIVYGYSTDYQTWTWQVLPNARSSYDLQVSWLISEDGNELYGVLNFTNHYSGSVPSAYFLYSIDGINFVIQRQTSNYRYFLDAQDEQYIYGYYEFGSLYKFPKDGFRDGSCVPTSLYASIAYPSDGYHCAKSIKIDNKLYCMNFSTYRVTTWTLRCLNLANNSMTTLCNLDSMPAASYFTRNNVWHQGNYIYAALAGKVIQFSLINNTANVIAIDGYNSTYVQEKAIVVDDGILYIVFLNEYPQAIYAQYPSIPLRILRFDFASFTQLSTTDIDAKSVFSKWSSWRYYVGLKNLFIKED